MDLIIDTYFSKVVDDPSASFGRRVTSDYVLQSRTNMGHDTRDMSGLRKAQKAFNAEEIRPGVFKQTEKPYYGVRSYRLVYLDDSGLESFYTDPREL